MTRIPASSLNSEPGQGEAPPPAEPPNPANLLFRYTDALYRAGSVSEIHEAALDAICEGLGSPRASILRFDVAGVMRFAAWRGLSAAYRAAVEGHSPWRPDEPDAQPICIEDIKLSSESDDLKEIVLQQAVYCGVPAANTAFHMLDELAKEQG